MAETRILIKIDETTNALVDERGRVYCIVSANDLLSASDVLDRVRAAVRAALQQRGGTDNRDVPIANLLKLTARERTVFECLMQAKNTKATARALQVSTKTVEYHRRNIFKKLNVQSVPELIREYQKCV